MSHSDHVFKTYVYNIDSNENCTFLGAHGTAVEFKSVVELLYIITSQPPQTLLLSCDQPVAACCVVAACCFVAELIIVPHDISFQRETLTERINHL